MIDFLFVLNVVILFFLVLLIYRKNRSRPLGYLYVPGLVIKLIAGVGVGLLYFFYYQGGDTLLFHEDGTRLAGAAFTTPGQFLTVMLYNDQANDLWGQLLLTGQPRALFMAKLVALVHILTDSSYWLTGFYFTLFAYSGLWVLADRLATYFPWTRRAAILAFLFFPTVVFWSSGITKEAVSTGLISWIIALYIPTLAVGKGIHKREILLSLFFMFLLWIIKYHYAAILMAILAPTLLVGVLKNWSVGISWSYQKQILYWASFLVWSFVVASFIHPNLQLTSIADVIVENHDLYLQKSNSESVVMFTNLNPSFFSFLRNFPVAMYAGIFQPLPWEVGGFPKIIAAIENLIVLVLSLLALANIGRINVSNNGILVVALLTYVILTAALLAFAAPNLGTLARYKSGFIPLLIYIVIADPIFRRFYQKKVDKGIGN